MGVYYRGTDYKKMSNWNPIGHAISPIIERFAEDVDEYCRGKEIKTIFFMTDEQEALDYCKDFFEGYDFIYIKHTRFSNFKYGNSISTMTPEGLSRTENNRYYLADIYILSMCDYLFSTMNSGTIMALNLNGNRYIDVKLMDYGKV